MARVSTLFHSRRASNHAPDTRLTGARVPQAPLWPTASIVFLLCVQAIFLPIVPTVLNIVLVLLALVVALLSKHSFDKRLLKIGAAFVVIAALGLVMGVDADRYEYIKDAWYVLNPVLVIAVGYVFYMAKPDVERGLRAFIIAGLILGVWQLRAYMSEPSLLLLPAGTIRRYVGTGFYAPVLALVILLVYVGRWRSGLKLGLVTGAVLFAVLSIAVAGVFSRTGLMVVLIGALALAGGFSKNEWLRLGIPIAIGIGLLFSSQLLMDTDSDRALQTFGGKLARSAQEVFATDYTDLRDINVNYRGYETQRAMGQFADSTVMQMLIGQGFGATIDLGVSLPLQGSETGGRMIRFITYLHNGYMFLLTKVGVTGVMLYVSVLIYLYLLGRPKAAQSINSDAGRLGRLFQAAIITLAMTTYVVGGVFNKMDMFPFLLLTGFLLAHFRRLEETLGISDSGTEKVRSRQIGLTN